MPEWLLLWEINSIFEKQLDHNYVIQCDCGRVDIINGDIFKEIHEGEIATEVPTLQCNRCKGLHVEFKSSMDQTAVIKDGLEELEKIFDKAKDENYMTFCYFLWQSLSIENEQLNEIQRSVDLIFDQYIKNNLEVFLQARGLSVFKISDQYHHERQYILCLMALNHIIEIDGIYDLILSFAFIAESEQYLIGDDGHSIQPVGMTIKKENEDTNRSIIKTKISSLKKWLRSKKYMKLARLIQLAFNYELRVPRQRKLDR